LCLLLSVAVLHLQFFPGEDGEAFVGGAVADLAGRMIIDPVLIAHRTVTRVDHDILPRIVNAHLIPSNLSRLAIAPVLIPTLPMTGIQPKRLVDMLLCRRAVETGGPAQPQVANLPVSECLSRYEQLWVDVREEPLEILAV